MKSSKAAALLFTFPFLLWAEEATTPSLELFEFLAEGARVDGQWVDPVEVDEMMIPETVSSGDEVESHE